MDDSGDNKTYYTKDYFLDIFGRRVNSSDSANGFRCKVNGEEMVFGKFDSKMDESGFQMWHVEHKESPNIETGPSYLELPMPKFGGTEEEYAEYNRLMELAWKHIPWHTSHQPHEQPIANLNQEVNQKLAEWKAKAPPAYVLARKRFLSLVNNVQNLLNLCDYGAAKRYLELLKMDITNAAFA